MEGVPRIPMIGFPLKRSADVPDFKSKIKRFISHHYNEDPEAYNQEITNLESLRAAATHVSRDFTGCATLKKYFCQLNFLKSRFPFQEGSQIATSFSWYDAYSDSVHGWKDIDFEMACILYNIGALHSELGTKDARINAEGMKTSCTHFQCAAWAFQHLKNDYHKFFSPDLTSDVLSIMTNICLAQAQECILEKSLIDNRKSAITAKVSLQIVEYYQQTLKTIELVLKKSTVTHSDKVMKAVKKWKDLVEAKSHYYSSLSYLYRGLHAEEQSKFGERVTFFKASVDRLNESMKCAKNIVDKNESSAVLDTLNFTADVVGTKLSSSEKENEFVYHEKVPELDAVEGDLKGVSLVKGIPFKFDDAQISGPDIFARLVPMEAHEASSMYSEEKAKILRTYSAKVEEKNAALDRFLLAMQLDHLDIHDGEESSVPQELVDCCAALSVNPEAVKKLSALMSKLSGMFHDVEHNLKEINQLLKAEEAAEKEECEALAGKVPPPNNLMTELAREVKKYEQAHIVASESNQTLHEAMRIHVVNLQILLKPFRDVVKSIPSAADAEVRDEAAIQEMRRLRRKIEEMRSQREMLTSQLRDSILSDDITKTLVVKQDQDLEAVFTEELKKHERVTQLLDQNLVAQDNILRAVTEANAAYAATRKATEEVLKRRSAVIQDLLGSYDAYNELLIKCTQGVEFYTKLDTNVSKLLQRVRSAAKVLQEEREERAKSLRERAAAAAGAADPLEKHSGGTVAKGLYGGYSVGAEQQSPPLSGMSAAGYDAAVQEQYEKNLALQQQYEKNLALQQQYEKNMALQQQYEKNMALQREYEQLSKLRQGIGTGNDPSVGSAGGGAANGGSATAYAPNYLTDSGASQSYSVNTGMYGTPLTSVGYYSPVPAAQQQPSPAPPAAAVGYPVSSSPAVMAGQYIPQSSAMAQAYGTASTTATQPYVASSMQSQLTYLTNSGNQPYSSIASMGSSGAAAPTSSVSVVTSEPAAAIVMSAAVTGGGGVVPPVSCVPARMDSAPAHHYGHYSANPLLEQYSQQQYGPTPQYGSYPILSGGGGGGGIAGAQELGATARDAQAYGLPNQYGQQSYQYGSQSETPALQGGVTGDYSTNQVPMPEYGSNAATQQQEPTYTFSKLPAQGTSNVGGGGTYYMGGSFAPASAATAWTYAGGAGGNPSGAYGYPASGQVSGPLTNYYTEPAAPLTGYPNSYAHHQPLPTTANHQQGYETSQGVVDPSAQYPPKAYETPQVKPVYSPNEQQLQVTYGGTGAAPHPSESSAPQVVARTDTGNPAPVQPSHPQPQSQRQSSEGFLSNVDLLAGVDLALPHPPLQPVTSSAPLPPSSTTGGTSERTAQINSSAVAASAMNGDGSVVNGRGCPRQDEQHGPVPPTGNPLNILNVTTTTTKISNVVTAGGGAEARKASMDHLSDPALLDKFVKDAEKLDHTFQGFYKKSLNGPTNLDMKWKEVMDIQNAASIKMSISVARCYPMKNRYADILPHDQTRVPLPCTKDDYINASFVRDISPCAIPFIATQAPLPVTFSDFWHMVWFHQVELIACLTSDADLKDHIYWPLERGKDLDLGPLSISLQAKNVKPTWVERIFCISNRDVKQTRVTIHLQFKGWTGNAFPENPSPFLSFINEVHNFFVQQRSQTRPVVVHCMSGVGKTGVFAILSAAIREIQNGRAFPDLTSIAGIASEERKGIMNDKEYLRFSYQCLLYFCQDMLMKRGILTGRSNFEEKMKPSHTRHPSQDFLAETVKKILSTEVTESPDEPPSGGGGNVGRIPKQSSPEPPSVTRTGSSSLPSTPVHGTEHGSENGSQGPAVPALGRGGRIFSDVPATLLDVDASTFQQVLGPGPAGGGVDGVMAVGVEPKRNNFQSRKGALMMKKKMMDMGDELTADPLDTLDPLWTIKK